MSKLVISRHESQRADLAEKQCEEMTAANRFELEFDGMENALERMLAKTDDPIERDKTRRFCSETRDRIYSFIKNLARTGDEMPF